MAVALTLYRTTIGKKVVMAVSGLVLVGFVIVHMLGNLKIYEGPAKINAYGVFLREIGDPFFSPDQMLWSARIVLLVAVVLHLVAAYQLTRRDLAGRPVAYASRRNVAAGYAARTMRWGGVIILLFVIYHILHFTTGSVHPSFERGNIYHNVVAGFRVWYVSAFYIAAMVALATHLYHGAWSMFQTLGVTTASRTRFWRGLALAIALAVGLGNSSIPLAVLTGIVK
jgi:succinate dehydrogenase / fumarate reductase cytochrome b subunit